MFHIENVHSKWSVYYLTNHLIRWLVNSKKMGEICISQKKIYIYIETVISRTSPSPSLLSSCRCWRSMTLDYGLVGFFHSSTWWNPIARFDIHEDITTCEASGLLEASYLIFNLKLYGGKPQTSYASVHIILQIETKNETLNQDEVFYKS